MVRLLKALVHLSVFAAGIAVLLQIDFTTPDLPQGLFMPLAGIAFFVYLIAFLATGSYRVFRPRRFRSE
jgi:hypothetical protein